MDKQHKANDNYNYIQRLCQHGGESQLACATENGRGGGAIRCLQLKERKYMTEQGVDWDAMLAAIREYQARFWQGAKGRIANLNREEGTGGGSNDSK